MSKKAVKKSKKQECKECGKSFVDLKSHVERMHDGFELEIKVNDVEYTAHGKTVREALESFIDSNEFPFGAKTHGVFIVRKDGKEATLRVPPIRVRRLFLQFPKKDTAVAVFASTIERRLTA